MQSKTSFFNKTLFRKNLTRFCPLWIIYLGIWLIVLPFAMLQTYSHSVVKSWQIQNLLLSLGSMFGVILACGYGAVCALAIFSYLFNTRSANTLHAMPFRREQLFLTNFLSGLAFAVVPNLIIVLMTLVVEAVIGVIALQATLQWFLMVTLAFLFFYGFAVFLAQLTGNGFFLIAIYCILNFTAFGVEIIIRFLLGIFVYGYTTLSSVITFGKLSPVYYLLAETTVNGENALYNTNGEMVHIDYIYNGWNYLAILAVIGVLFTVIAFLLYRRRNIESAGDVIAVQSLRPVFKYCFAIGFSLIFGAVLYSFVQQPQIPIVLFAQVACFMLIGTFFGYFLAEILIQKSFRVFRKGWKGFTVVAICIVALLAVSDCGLFGYEKYVPNAEEVEDVVISYIEGERGSKDADIIARVLALHEQLIAEKKDQEVLNVERQQLDYSDKPTTNRWIQSETCNIIYHMKSGETITRSYDLNYELWEGKNDLENEASLISRYEKIYNDPIFVMLRSLPEMEINSQEDIQFCTIDYLPVAETGEEQNYNEYEYCGLSSEQAYELLTTCIIPDLQDGLLGTTNFGFDEESKKEQYCISIEFGFNYKVQDYRGEWTSSLSSYSFGPTIYSERTNAYLEKLGIQSITRHEESLFYRS